MAHPVQWTAAAPLWDEASRSADDEIRGMFGQPSILRFATDTFMEDFLGLIETSPSRLGELVAQPETWREALPPVNRETPDSLVSFGRTVARFRLPGGRARRLPGAAGSAFLKRADPKKVLKLYQPAHQRYYLVAATLVCRQPGLPDRALDTGRVSFVLRRLLRRVNTVPVVPDDPTTYDEYAFVTTGERTGWQKVVRTSVPRPTVLVPGEDQLPLFPAAYTHDDGHRRRLLAGMIPVGRREAYMGGPPIPLPAGEEVTAGDDVPAVPGNQPLGPREVLFRSQVTEPWKQLVARAAAVKTILAATIPDVTPAEELELKRQLRENAREQIQTGSWYVLLDFAKYLQDHLPGVWTRLETGQAPSGGLSTEESNLVTALVGTTASDAFKTRLLDSQEAPPAYTETAVKSSLVDALTAIVQHEARLEAVDTPFRRVAAEKAKWPPFLFPLADPGNLEEPPTPPKPPSNPTAVGAVNQLARLVDVALRPPAPGKRIPQAAVGAQPIAGVGDPGWFVIRCVYERPRCSPLEKDVVSEPTPVFQLAGFFDPDAPARPIRIALPIDTTPAGLRKFNKNTAFMVSDILCGQISEIKKSLTLGDLVLSVLPWPFHKDLPSSLNRIGPCKTGAGVELGMICSFSIPIITICALILLMIIVTLFDLIFRWLPWFFICFPLSKFKGKEA